MLRFRSHCIHTSEVFLTLLQGVQRDTCHLQKFISNEALYSRNGRPHFLALSLCIPPFWDYYTWTPTALGVHDQDNVSEGCVKRNRHAAVSSPTVGCD